jgi:hypothetical protein
MARFKFLKYVNGFSNRNRRSQRARYYFRRRGIKAIPCPASQVLKSSWRLIQQLLLGFPMNTSRLEPTGLYLGRSTR